MAIDPDVDKSGVAILDIKERTMETMKCNLPELVDEMRMHAQDEEFMVVVEAAYLSQTNWHLEWNDSQRRAAAKGRQVGRNHEIGRQIVQFCIHLGIPYEEKYPLRKCWAGKDGKITQEELNDLIEGMNVSMSTKRMNQEERDAALIALDRSGLPMRMIPKKKQR